MSSLKIIKADFKRYAFTLRKTKIQKTKKTRFTDEELTEIYESRIHEFTKSGLKVGKFTYEQKAGLHVHGVIDIPKTFNLVKLKRRGWSILLKEIFDEEGWDRYMSKDQNKDYKPNDEDLKDYQEWLDTLPKITDSDELLPAAGLNMLAKPKADALASSFQASSEEIALDDESSIDDGISPSLLNKKLF